MSLTLEDIRSEARDLQDRCLLSAERHFAAEGPWYYLNYWLGIPAAVLAAAAGAAGLSQVTGSAAIIAGMSFVVAALTSLLTFLQPIRRADTHHYLAKSYESLYNKIGLFHRIQSRVTEADMTELRSALNTFTETFNELNKRSPAMSLHAQRRAKARIAKGTGEVVAQLEADDAGDENP